MIVNAVFGHAKNNCTFIGPQFNKSLIFKNLKSLSHWRNARADKLRSVLKRKILALLKFSEQYCLPQYCRHLLARR